MDLNVSVIGNGVDWCEYNLADISKRYNYNIFNTKTIPLNSKILNKLCLWHYSETANRFFKVPFKSIWYKSFCRKVIKPNTNNILVFYDHNRLSNDEKFLQYIKKNYKKAKLIYIFTNIVKFSGASYNNFVERLHLYFDRIYAFDPTDARQYGFDYHPLLYSKTTYTDIHTDDSVFYVGRAKDRYLMLVDIFERLDHLGIKKKFYIFGVPENTQKHADEIIYNKMIPYSECLKHIQESFCLIDVIQGESEGFTIKVCEAVFYNKLLITTNESIKKAPFYNEKWILVMKDPNDITTEFLSNAYQVNYSQEDRNFFSAFEFFTKLEREFIVDGRHT